MIYRIPTLKKHPIYLCMGVRGILGCFCILFINYTYICVVRQLKRQDPDNGNTTLI
jgi:hypothetical protein